MRKLITTDSHLVPPPWLLDELPEELRVHLSRRTHELVEREGERFLQFPTAAAEGLKRLGLSTEVKIDSDDHLVKILHLAYEVDAYPSWDPVRRLEDLARDGVVAAVMIHNPVRGVRRRPVDVDAQIAYCKVINDWQAETFRDHLHCFAPGIHLPFLDPAACVTELERAAALGLRPGLLPDGIWDAPYWEPEWEPLWEAAAGLGVPLTLHVGGTRTQAAAEHKAGPNVYGGETFEGFYGGSCDMGRTLIWFTFSGMFQKYPALKIVMTEGYAFWMAGLMQFCDHHWEGRFKSVADVKVELEAPPSYYMKRQARATFMWDPVALRNRDVTGTDSLLWANDYPHPEGSFPDSQQWVEKQFAGMPEDEIERITFSNAAELFGFNV